MKSRHIIATAVALLGLAGAAGAQPPPPVARPVPAEQIDYLSCREAWRQSGKSAEQFIPMLRSLANQSLQERGLVLASDRETGLQLGKAIIQGCVNDPEEHLSSVVDREVRKVAAPKQ